MGWLCFVVAAVTYLLTVEPTASFWDCPEFILQGFKLEVGHPPGNPIFMLAARFMITLFGGSAANAALAVNCMSALLSAATILLLFWSVTHLVRRLIVSDDAREVNWWQMLLIMGGGVCGALAYTWSDTFWFSAVEGEVYAFSSFCTALVVWLMFKWENRADKPHSDRYLVLIAYVIGVSIAVHLLNLLCIPALGLIFYYRKWRDTNAKGSLIALAVSCVIVGAILYGLVPGFIEVAQWFELLFVNGFHLSYNMGAFIYAVVLTAVFIMSIKTLYQARNAKAARLWFFLAIAMSGMPFIGHTIWVGVLLLIVFAVWLWGFCKKIPVRIFSLIVLSIFVIFIGYASYALLLIRASANTPMNQNAPDNVFALASYLNREQYGDRPLFNGPVFAETVLEQEYPAGSGNYYIPVDDYGRPQTRIIDGYLRDENGAAFNTPEGIYTKVVKTDPSQPDEYVKEVERPDYRTMGDLDMLMTRIYSSDERHVQGYKAWAGYMTPDINNIPQPLRQKWAEQGFAPKAEVMPYLNSMEPVTSSVYASSGAPAAQTAVWKPDFCVNLRYFINYQLNHMYWRYFMWNFAGRQNDIQGNGEPHRGNWISGIPAIDNARLGDQSALPDDYGKGNKGHNVFYMLPLILGIIGLLYQALYQHRTNPMRGIQQFWVVFFLFFMTGIAIVLYLNQTPGQPRERDYAFAGSFYAYAIWIGMGVPAIGVMLRNLLSPKAKKTTTADGIAVPEQPRSSKGVLVATAAIACAIGLAVPLQMVSQTWDDHDRSGRYTTRDFGFNYLSSLDENAIIFTNGDNDTFPLWYAQEVENFRPDVRVVNLSYLTTDWYANQMQHPTLGAEAIPMTAQPKDYAYERLAYSFIVPASDDTVETIEALKNLYSSDASRFGYPNTHYLAEPKMSMSVDSAKVMARYDTGVEAYNNLYLAPFISDIYTDMSASSGINQSKVLSLDMIANSVANDFNRPAYFATTVPESYYLGLTPYLGASGLAYEVTPFTGGSYSVTADKSYCKIVSDYRWGGLDGPDAKKLYLDETVRRMVESVRSGIYSVVEDLMATGHANASDNARRVARENGLEEPSTRFDMARQLLDMLQTKLSPEVTPYDGILGLYIARAYLDLYLATGNSADLDAAEAVAKLEGERYAQLVKYATTLSPLDRPLLGAEDNRAMKYLGEAVAIVNYADMLRKASPEQINEIKAIIRNTSIESDLRLASILYIEGYDYQALADELSAYPQSQRGIVQVALDVLHANAVAGTDPMAYSNQLMSDHGFTARQWLEVAD